MSIYKPRNVGEIADHYLLEVDWSSMTPEYMHNLMVNACCDALEMQYNSDEPKFHVNFLQGKRVQMQEEIREMNMKLGLLEREIFGKSK